MNILEINSFIRMLELGTILISGFVGVFALIIQDFPKKRGLITIGLWSLSIPTIFIIPEFPAIEISTILYLVGVIIAIYPILFRTRENARQKPANR